MKKGGGAPGAKYKIPCPPKPKKKSDNNIYHAISEFAKIEMEDAKKEKKGRLSLKVEVSIDPDSVIGKEIKYQTALLHEILNEIRGRKSSP